MLLGNGYLTRKGFVLITAVEVVRNGVMVAEPNDMLNVEGDEVSNLSRVAKKDPRPTRFPLAGAKWLSRTAVAC